MDGPRGYRTKWNKRKDKYQGISHIFHLDEGFSGELVLFLNCKKSQRGLFSILAGVEGHLPCLQAHPYTDYWKMQEQFSHVKSPSLELLSFFSPLLSVDRNSKVIERQPLKEICGSSHVVLEGLPTWLSGSRSRLQCRRCWFDPGVRKTFWKRAWQPTPVSLPGESHGQGNLVGYSPGAWKEWNMAESTEHACTRGSGRKGKEWELFFLNCLLIFPSCSLLDFSCPQACCPILCSAVDLLTHLSPLLYMTSLNFPLSE